ncbi:MAG TPA: DUF4351 domain-containing protein [Pirellulales bacterium]|nr:DUF4351 domain-containing protein [Pirellulales bacterium]
MTEEQRQQFEEMLRNHPDPGVQAMEIGLLDGVEQRGMERGKVEGQRELLRKQLEARFGPLPPAVAARLQESPSDRLTDLGCALLSAASIEELGLGAS